MLFFYKDHSTNKQNSYLFKKKSETNKINSAFKDAFVKICSESTSHGLPNIFRNDNWFIKVYWILPLLGGSAAATYCK